MRARHRIVWIALAAVAVGAGRVDAAIYQHLSVDGKWYDGKAVSTTYGAYQCQMRFNGNEVFLRLAGSSARVVGVLDDEVITDPHEIVVHDPKRGGDWTLDCYDLGS